jgi:hypothetical protein
MSLQLASAEFGVPGSLPSISLTSWIYHCHQYFAPYMSNIAIGCQVVKMV